jgi:hypothetical protein
MKDGCIFLSCLLGIIALFASLVYAGYCFDGNQECDEHEYKNARNQVSWFKEELQPMLKKSMYDDVLTNFESWEIRDKYRELSRKRDLEKEKEKTRRSVFSKD